MEELIKTLEEIKEHQMQTVQLARTTTVYKLADKAIQQALSIANVVGQSEQLKTFNCINVVDGLEGCNTQCAWCEKVKGF